jgi:hypothetical protein
VSFAKAMGSEPVHTAFRSPWQNGVAERWVGSCQRDLLDHVIILNERHLKTANGRVRALLPPGPDASGARERQRSQSARRDSSCIGKPDLLLSQTGRTTPLLRGRGIKQFLTVATIRVGPSV